FNLTNFKGRACPHHGFSELHQLDTFYNAMNVNDQDSLNSAAGGNFLDKIPRECLKIIKSKSKVRQSRAKAVVAMVGTSSSTPVISSDVAELKDMVKALLLDKKTQSPAPTPSTTPAPVKAVYANTASSSGSDTLPGNTVTNPKEELKGITTRSGVAYQEPKTLSPSKQGTKAVVAKVGTSSSTPVISSDVAELKDMVRALLLDKKNQSPAPTPSTTPAPVKAVESNCVTCGVESNCVTCGGTHSYQNCPATSGNVYQDNIHEYVSQAAAANYNQGNTGFHPQMVANQIRPPGFPPVQNNQNNFNRENNFTQNRGGSGTLPGNTVTNPKEDLKGITTRSGVAYQRPKIPAPSKVVKQGTKVTKDQPIAAPVSAPMPNLKPSIPYPSRHDNERRREKANEQIKKFYKIFKDMSFEISFTDALILMPKFASTLKALIGNKEKLSEIARTPMNEHCSAVILNKLPKKLGDPGKFLIPYEFSGMDECLALADLGASINLMTLSVWKELALPELTPTCMTLELANRSVSKPIGIAKDVSVKVGMFHFLADFVVVDFKPDPRVSLILERCFLKTGRALIDVHKGELTLRIGNEAITYNLDQTSRYSANYDQVTANKIDVTDEDREDDFLLFEKANAFLGLEDDPDSPELDPSYYDPEGDIQNLKAILNSDPAPSLPNHKQSVPSFKNELKACESKTIKSFVDEPPEVELKDLPPHLEYAFLEGDNKLPVIIAKELGGEEKAALIMVLKSHKQAIAWKLSDIQGINPEFCTHKILMEEDYKPMVQHQRRVNPKIHDIIKKEVEKLLDVGLIYPISDSPWVSPVHCVPKKGGFIVVRNEENELIPTRLVTGWRDTPFIFSEDCIKAFQTLKQKLTEAPILIAPNWDLPFKLMCDASDFAIGAVLGQCYEKYFRPIHYASKTLTEAESNYTTTEKEMLAVVYAFEKFRSYLIMNKCIVHTDHSALKYLFAKKDAKARLLRWVLLLKEFDFDVLDTKRAENLAAVHLSRLEKPYENVLDPKEINETIPLETLSTVTFRGDSSAPWFADFANYHAETIETGKGGDNFRERGGESEEEKETRPTTPPPSKVVKQGAEVTKDQVQTLSSQNTAQVQPPVTQSETPVSKLIAAFVSAPMPNLKPSIPYLSRHDNERRREQANEQIEKFYEIFKDMSFEISFMDALILMPKFASTLKALIGNKEKLSKMARTPMNEHCSLVRQ
nr:DNA-directed DNA polymerase [Tanacetum cinerariifolium]